MILQDRTIIVTGAASGIGETTARHLSSVGANVVIADINPAGERIAAEIRDSGRSSLFVRTDVSDESSVESMVSKAVSQFGSIEGALTTPVSSRRVFRCTRSRRTSGTVSSALTSQVCLTASSMRLRQC
ncbi:SDR family oxidoreductase [Rhodococcus sp. DMU2021]|nr:SDR family oxidoreductase [Rhodococcus sp. DMU2021]